MKANVGKALPMPDSFINVFSYSALIAWDKVLTRALMAQTSSASTQLMMRIIYICLEASEDWTQSAK
jgi:hypothetical protein